MKKIVIAFILALTMLVISIPCFAADASELNTADALNELCLFLGTGNGYELENSLTRAQGVTLLVRMLGMEEAAENTVYNNSFTDVPDWAAGYIGCAFENRLTNGTSETTFSPDETMTDYMFLTLVMRALNYSDNGENPMFVWNNPYSLAFELGLIANTESDIEFTRADAVKVFWNALNCQLNGTENTLSDQLVEQEVFTSDELKTAREIQENGRRENIGVPVNPDDKTEAKPQSKPIPIPSSKPDSESELKPDTESEQEQENETQSEQVPGAGKGEFPIG